MESSPNRTDVILMMLAELGVLIVQPIRVRFTDHFLPRCVGFNCTRATTIRHIMRYQGLVVVILVGCALVLTFRRLFHRPFAGAAT